MIKQLIFKLYRVLPRKMRNKIGRSFLLKPFRDIFLRHDGIYREFKVLVTKNYFDYHLKFYFFGSLKVASKAASTGIENTLLRNSLTLLEKFKAKEEDKVVFDVGANFGYLSLVWANTISKNGKVYAFEPNINVYNSFNKAIKANQLSSTVYLNNLAVGERDGMIDLFLNSTTSNILNDNQTAKEKIPIEMISLDSFALKNNIYRCDLVKIDVDGIELEILKGGIKLIEKFQPLFIVETNGNSKIIDFFVQYNYEVLDMKLHKYQIGEKLPPNIFCIPKTL